MPIKSRKRLVHITLDESLLDDSGKLQGVVREIEKTTGEKADESARLRKYGILSTLADSKEKKAIGSLAGVVAVEEDKAKHASG